MNDLLGLKLSVNLSLKRCDNHKNLLARCVKVLSSFSILGNGA